MVKSSAMGMIQAYFSNVPRTPERKKLIHTEAKDLPNNDMEDSRRGEADMYPELTVPTENDTVTVFASPGMNELFKKKHWNQNGLL